NVELLARRQQQLDAAERGIRVTESRQKPPRDGARRCGRRGEVRLQANVQTEVGTPRQIVVLPYAQKKSVRLWAAALLKKYGGQDSGNKRSASAACCASNASGEADGPNRSRSGLAGAVVFSAVARARPFPASFSFLS